MGANQSIPIIQCIHQALEASDGAYAEFSSLHQDLDDEGRTKLGTTYLMKCCEKMPFNKTDKQLGMKSSDLSIRLRNEGNKHFMKYNQEALLLYSKSIAAAPYPSSAEEDSEQLALGFANRSAVYFEMKNYDACLRDIEQALMFNYPSKLKYKLLERRAKCYQCIGRKEDALASSQEGEDSLKAATHLTEDQMKSTIAALKKLQLDPGSARADPPATTKPYLPEKAFPQHPNIPSAADCMEVKYNEEMGRYIVATRDISPGDTFLVEKPFAAVVKQDWYPTHCFNCIKRSDAMIPCKMCNYAMFCSTECRDDAWQTYHNIECRLVPALNNCHMGGALLPLRMFLTACSKSQGLEELQRLVQEIETQNTEDGIKGFDKNGQYKSTDYHQIHYLFRSKLLEPKDQLMHALLSASILNALDELADFFSNTTQNSSKSKEAKKFASGLIVKLVDISNFNTDGVTETVIGTNKFRSHGCGVYNTSSLFAHSCYPNTTTCFYNGNTLGMTAVRSITKGEMISTSYSVRYCDMTTIDRMAYLKQKYNFWCRCQACNEHWLVKEKLQDFPFCGFLCHECRSTLHTGGLSMVTCTTCNKKYDFDSILERLFKMFSRVDLINVEILRGSTHDFTPELAEYVKLVHQYLRKPNRGSYQVEDVMEKSISAKGNIARF